MKCSNCATTNGETNKFCRECGLRLGQAAQQTAQQPDDTPRLDEVALGEELFEVWQIFESGQMDAALKMAEKFARNYPDSASSHSLVALVYERIAQQELENGRTQEWHDLLKLAVKQYEIIIDLNPDSTGDREKLASLRMKLVGGVPFEQKKSTSLPAPFDEYWTKLKNIPIPILAASGAFLVCLVLILVMTSNAHRPGGEVTTPSSRVRTSYYQDPGMPATPQQPGSQPMVQRTSPPSTGFTSGTPPKLDIDPARAPKPDPEPSSDTNSVEPTKIHIPSAELSIVPQAKPKPDKPKPATGKPHPDKAVPILPITPVSVVVKTPSTSGSTLLAQAIMLHDQGKGDEAVATAGRAVDAFQADIAAGRSVESAKRGVQNAQKLVGIWQRAGSE